MFIFFIVCAKKKTKIESVIKINKLKTTSTNIKLGDGLGLKVIGGKDIPGTNMIGAYIARIHSNLSMNGEIREGKSYEFDYNYIENLLH